MSQDPSTWEPPMDPPPYDIESEAPVMASQILRQGGQCTVAELVAMLEAYWAGKPLPYPRSRRFEPIFWEEDWNGREVVSQHEPGDGTTAQQRAQGE